jgi:hypothetical protein
VILVKSFFSVQPWQFTLFLDHFVCNDVWSEQESVYSDIVSASDSVSAAMISVVILPTVGTVQGLQQYSSEGLRTPYRGERSNTQLHRWKIKGRSHISGVISSTSNKWWVMDMSFFYIACNWDTKHTHKTHVVCLKSSVNGTRKQTKQTIQTN